MKQQFSRLEQLQKLDLEVHELERARLVLPKRLVDLDARKEEVGRKLKAQRDHVVGVEAEKRTLETALRIEEEKLKKGQAKLNEAKNEKEFQAGSKEVDSARRAKAHFEDEILRAIEVVETAKKSAALVEEEAALVTAEYDALAADVRQEEARLDAQIDSFSARREEARRDVDPALLKRYDHIRLKRAGVALAPAQGGTCGACNMGLPPQLYNQVLKGISIETCPSCIRILYVKPSG
ncbi:MAG: hypothetical protein HYY84_08830 [Deltaproteobacteria bacterium]|nr:hypothetical protein [Deltaproteobacteria bacterium]